MIYGREPAPDMVQEMTTDDGNGISMFSVHQ